MTSYKEILQLFNKIKLRKHLKEIQQGNRAFCNIVDSKIRNKLDGYLNIKVTNAKFQPITNNNVDLVISSSRYVTSCENKKLQSIIGLKKNQKMAKEIEAFFIDIEEVRWKMLFCHW